MQKSLVTALAVFALAGALFATVDKDYPERNVINPPYALWRGLANTCTFWLEYPRCIVYDTDRMTPLGIFLSPFTGTFYACARVILSGLDFALLGCTGPSGYSENFIREYVFQMPWNAYKGEDKVIIEKPEKGPVKFDELKEVNLNTLL